MSRVWHFVRFATTAGIVGLVFFMFLDVALWIIPPNRGWASWSWRDTEAISVGGGYSVSLQVRPAHPMLAEYDQRLVVFGGGPREGRELSRIDLPMNTGGRVNIAVYRRSISGTVQLFLRDRYRTSLIDLKTQKIIASEIEGENDFSLLGVFSGEAFPMKFIPASVWNLMSPAEKGERANQPPQRNAGSRPSSMNASASETPSSLGPRG